MRGCRTTVADTRICLRPGLFFSTGSPFGAPHPDRHYACVTSGRYSQRGAQTLLFGALSLTSALIGSTTKRKKEKKKVKAGSLPLKVFVLVLCLKLTFAKDAHEMTQVLGSGRMTQGLDKVHKLLRPSTFGAGKACDTERFSIM